MYSMTGYGKAEYRSDKFALTVEIKTVNNRNFDFNAKMPRAFISLEDGIRKKVSEYIKRARIELFVNFTDLNGDNNTLSVNLNKARDYLNASKLLAKELKIKNDFTVSTLMKYPDVLESAVNDNSEEVNKAVIETVENACVKLNEMRKIEGEKLIDAMLKMVDNIETITNEITAYAPNVAKEYKEKLKERIVEALADVKYDEARLLNEVAFYTDKVNIDEELTRLKSHVAQFRDIINTEGAGKKLDFLMQEFNREANTICSKSNDINVTRLALSLKNEIEKVREQVQNIE